MLRYQVVVESTLARPLDMTREEAVLKAGPYYHHTPIERAESVATHGLIPDYDSEKYDTLPEVPARIVCVAPHQNRRKYLSAVASWSDSGAVATFRIDAEDILTLRFDLDRTNSELAGIKRRVGSDDFADLLLGGADLMVFDLIPASLLRRVQVD